MLYLNTTGNTKVTVTLYEKSSNILNPNYTWKLVNKDTFVEKVFYQADFSPYPYYFNYFTISIATPENLTSGVIDVPPGQYQYYIYEMPAPADLDLNNAIGMVENGILNVIATYSTPNVYTASNTNTIPTYMGGL
jgi:hypothetical protein